MIVLATGNEALAKRWRDALSKSQEVYELTLSDKRNLELCLKKISIEILFIDQALFGGGGLHELSDLLHIQSQVQIVVFSEKSNERDEISAILFGAKAYCQYDLKEHLLLKVVDTIKQGEIWVDRKFVSRLLGEIEDITKAQHHEAQDLDKILSTLTPREKEIAKHIAGGSSNRKIAEHLNISERTVKAHLGVIFRKMGIEDRLQLALYINRHRQIGSIWHRKD